MGTVGCTARKEVYDLEPEEPARKTSRTLCCASGGKYPNPSLQHLASVSTPSDSAFAILHSTELTQEIDSAEKRDSLNKWKASMLAGGSANLKHPNKTKVRRASARESQSSREPLSEEAKAQRMERRKKREQARLERSRSQRTSGSVHVVLGTDPKPIHKKRLPSPTTTGPITTQKSRTRRNKSCVVVGSPKSTEISFASHQRKSSSPHQQNNQEVGMGSQPITNEIRYGPHRPHRPHRRKSTPNTTTTTTTSTTDGSDSQKNEIRYGPHRRKSNPNINEKELSVQSPSINNASKTPSDLKSISKTDQLLGMQSPSPSPSQSKQELSHPESQHTQSSPPIVADENLPTVPGCDPSDSQIQGIPQRFLAAEGGDQKKAATRWMATLTFRQAYKVDEILLQPHCHFQSIKSLYPHFYHKRTRQGQIVYYEAPGLIDIKALERQQITVDDLFWNSLYLSEFLWKEIETSDSGQILSVVDMKGVSVSDIANNGKVLEYIRRIGDCSRDHYPNRSLMVFMINVPKWFSFVWKHVLSPLLDANTKERTRIYGTDYIQPLTEFISIDDIPEVYGGKCRCQGKECRFSSDIEIALATHVKKYLSK